MKYRSPVMAVVGVTLVAILLASRFWPGPIAADILPDEVCTIGDSVRRYRLIVPHSRPSDRVPIVFAFHGVGGSPDGMSKYTELDRLAARHGFILVYPAARRGMWATVNIDASELDDNPDLLFIGQLIDEVGTRLNVDSNRVYLVGMSNGASFAQLVAFARPDVAAVVAHSGPKPHGLNEAVEPFPIMLVAGANDLAAEAMRSDAIEYRKDKHPVDLIVVPGLGHEWSTKHNAVMWSFLSRHQRRN